MGKPDFDYRSPNARLDSGAFEDAETSASRPSKDNRTDGEAGVEQCSTADSEAPYWYLAKEFVENGEDDLGDIVFRALAVSGNTKLRRDAVRERRGQPEHIARRLLPV